MIYGLLPNKREATYIRFFNLLKSKLLLLIKLKIIHFKCDYEQAQFNAVQRLKLLVASIIIIVLSGANKKKNNLDKTRSERNFGRLIALLPMPPPKYIQNTWKDILANVQMTTGTYEEI